MSTIRRRFINMGAFLQVVIMSTALSIILYTGGQFLLGPNPYTKVVVESTQEATINGEAGWRILAHFEKTACEFVRLEVVGITLGVPEIIKWDPIDNDSRDYDRNVGQQVLEIFVKPYDGAYDTLEIRTRHNCAGKSVDKVFATISLR
jgi:hypothetical protein